VSIPLKGTKNGFPPEAEIVDLLSLETISLIHILLQELIGWETVFISSLQSHKRIIKGEQGDSNQSHCENTADDETAFVLGALVVQDSAHGQDAHQDQNDDHVHTRFHPLS
jgi:hypothetical protein